MDRLSGLDASFLYLESLGAAAARLRADRAGPGDDPGRLLASSEFKDELERRIADVPMFHRKLKQVPLGIDHPVWVDDDDFDIDRHVHRMALPSPGGERELADLCGHMAGIPLDRSRPLWELWVIEGLESGKVAVFTKMHHATVDGVSGANVISYLCSLEPDAPPLETAPKGGAGAAYAERRRAARPRCGDHPGQAGAVGQAGRARRPTCSPRPSAAPAAARRWRRR